MPSAARRRPRPASSLPRSPRGRRALGRAVAALLLTFAVAVVPASSAHAFGTVWGILGQHSEHERVTRLGLQCGGGINPPECFQPVSLDNLAGKRGSFGAVGAADNIPLHLHRDRDYWHCDNSDWVAETLHGIRGRYGQSDLDAHRRLYQCVQWGRDKLYGTSEIGGGSFPPATPTWGAVPQARTLWKNGRPDTSNPGVGIFSTTCTYNGVRGLRPKCNVLEPFGYVLHMAEDFYSHTNWADLADPTRRLSVQNPIGLGRRDLASFLDLRAGYRGWEPGNFTGSCYPKKSCGDSRVIHGESSRDLGLNKDKGLIDIRTGRVTDPGTPRGAIVVDGVSNVQRAVDMAAAEARRQWAVFRDVLAQEYTPAEAARFACVLTLDRAEACDDQSLVVAVANGAQRRAAARGARAADAGSAGDDAEVAAAERLLKGLPRGARVAVVSFDRDSGVQDVDPFVRPGEARVDDAAAGDPEPDPDVTQEYARERDPEDDPTITPIADAATPGYTPEADEDFTHGSEEGAELNEEGEADPASPQSPLARAAHGSHDPDATAEALRSARRLLDERDAPRGQQGVALIADELGDVPAAVEQLRALRRDGVRVSLAVHAPRAVPARVLRAVEATGGSVLATPNEVELRRFSALVTSAGMTRLGDAFAQRKAPLSQATPPLLSVTASGRDMHAVAAPPKRATRLSVRAIDGALTAIVRDSGAGTTRRLRVAAGRAAALPLRNGRHYELLVAGPDGRRYETSLVR